MHFNKRLPVTDYPIVAFDTETSGAYPIASEIIELGAAKWIGGKLVDRFNVLLKPKKELIEENIRIHGITNEMLADAPAMATQIKKFCEFIEGSILVAHHAPFDLGFIALDIEQAQMLFPQNLIFCTSLLSRAVVPATNHKLQTLIKELNIEGGAAHRAFDDAYACLQVFFKVLERLEQPVSIERLQSIQKKTISWEKYKVFSSGDDKIVGLAKCCQRTQTMSIVYKGGKSQDRPRPIKPIGIVRNPDGDFLYAECEMDHQRKRFYLEKIIDFDRI